MIKNKFNIDVATANQLEDFRVEKGWSIKQLYLYYIGSNPNGSFDDVDLLEFDAFRKHIERKRNKIPVEVRAVQAIVDNTQGSNNLDVEYRFDGEDMVSATGSLTIKEEELEDPKNVAKFLFDKFSVDSTQFEIASYKTVYIAKTGMYRITATFRRKPITVVDEDAVQARYAKTLEGVGYVLLPTITEIDRDNIMVINLADVHWNKLPYKGFDSGYLDRFEQDIYNSIRIILERVKHAPIARVALTIGHDFFQTNDGNNGTKKQTPVSHVLEYRDMYDKGVQILANCLALVAQKYVVDAYYVMANHDEDSAWHAARELKLMFSQVGSVNVVVDSEPLHYIEWGSTLIELVHSNLKSGKGFSNMHVVASEAWGRTKYRYSIGGHLHGEYATKEANGIIAMGSRALSDTDSWHVLNGYVGNLRGLQAYIFNKDKGMITAEYANL